MKCLLLLLLFCGSLPLSIMEATSLRTLIVYDPSPETLLSTQADVKYVKAVCRYIAKKTRLQYTHKALAKDQFSIEILRTWLSSSKQSNKDVVIVYYLGNGHNSQVQNGQWPLITAFKNRLISETEVSAEVKNHNPRFALVIFDCYAKRTAAKGKINKLGFCTTKLSFKARRPGLRTLFCKNTGMITACSGFPVNSCIYFNRSSARGGYFTNKFLSTLIYLTKFKTANWSKVRILTSSAYDKGLARPIFDEEFQDVSGLPAMRDVSAKNKVQW